MKVTIDGMTFEGSEDEIERVVRKYGTQVKVDVFGPHYGPGPRLPPEDGPVVIGLRPGRVV